MTQCAASCIATGLVIIIIWHLVSRVRENRLRVLAGKTFLIEPKPGMGEEFKAIELLLTGILVGCGMVQSQNPDVRIGIGRAITLQSDWFVVPETHCRFYIHSCINRRDLPNPTIDVRRESYPSNFPAFLFYPYRLAYEVIRLNKEAAKERRTEEDAT